MIPYIKKFSEISITDINSVGGKNASLGEMYSKLAMKGVPVPDGRGKTGGELRWTPQSLVLE